jgi:hypothetical protein
MGIVEVVVVAGGWCFYLQCVWFTVFGNVFRELLHPIVFDVKVDY